MTKTEQLVDAIAWHNNFHDPESLAYRLKNPLLVRSFGKPGQHEIDEDGRRVFESTVGGYRACLFDMDLKLSGGSRAKLNGESCLENLLGVYGIKGPAQIERVVKFLRKALKDPALTGKTVLTYFQEA